jgi:RNA polymerase sigma-70 factor, ECF subfamily
MARSVPSQVPARTPGTPPAETGSGTLAFEALYKQHFAFVWRNLRRLGVPEASLRDAAQDVFVVVYRRLDEYEARDKARSWLYSIVTRVVREHARRRRRKDPTAVEDADTVADPRGHTPDRGAEQNESLRLLLELLLEIDLEKREAFILSDLEEMTAPEIAEALGVNLNTVYSRIRAARQELRAALRLRRALPREFP